MRSVRADRDRPPRLDFAAPAGRFARRIADAPADAGERVWRARDKVSSLVVALRDGGNVPARISMDRAGLLARDISYEEIYGGQRHLACG